MMVCVVYTDSDIDFLRRNQKKIIDLMNDRLLNLKKDFNSENLSLNDKENLIKSLQQHQLEAQNKIRIFRIMFGSIYTVIQFFH